MYDLVLKSGEVIDPAQDIHGTRDVAIKDGKIAAVEEDIDPSEAHEVIPIAGRIVTPGLIDLHCHCASGLVWFGVSTDEIGLDTGVTLLCDGGSAGAANFETMRRFIVEPSRTEVFCFLHIGSTGLLTMPELRDEKEIDLDWSKEVIEKNRNIIKGIKVRAVRSVAEGVGIRAVEIAKQLASDVKLPFVIHIGDWRERVTGDIMDDYTRAAVRMMDRGDILTHIMAWSTGGLILPDGTIYPELWEAKKRGVVLDACHGFSNFSLEVAQHAINQGVLPTVISTDFTIPARRVVQSLLVTMSKFLNLGLSIDQVVEMSTINPARALREEEKRGTLKPGLPADITVMELIKGDYLFSDGNGRNSLRGNLLLEPRQVLKRGVRYPCSSRYSLPPVYKSIQPSHRKDLASKENL